MPIKKKQLNLAFIYGGYQLASLPSHIHNTGQCLHASSDSARQLPAKEMNQKTKPKIAMQRKHLHHQAPQKYHVHYSKSKLDTKFKPATLYRKQL